MAYRYLLLTLFLSVFLTACGGGSSSSPAPVDDTNDETPDPGDNDDDNNGDDDDTANGDNDEATAAALVAHYRFQDNLEDATGNFAAGQITGDAPDSEGGAITYAAGAVDGSTAAVFDGTSGVQLGEGLIGPGDYSLSIWLHPDELSNFVPAFFGISNPNSWVSLVPGGGPGESDDAMLWAGDGDGTGWFDGTIGSQIPVGGWSHLVFTYTNGDLNTYLNGELAVEHTGFPNVFATENANFYLGINTFGVGEVYTGLIDDLRIYDVALNADQVTALHAGEEVEVNPDQISEDDGTTDDDDGTTNGDDGTTGGDDGTTGDDDSTNGGEEDAIAAITGLSAHYSFEDNLDDAAGNYGSGSVVGNTPDATEGGSISYDGNGIASGMALALDGSTGIRLPNGLVTGNAMSLSIWVNPTQITDWTSVFFADRLDGRWFSVIPKWEFSEAAVVRARVDETDEWWDVQSNIPEITSLNTNEWAHLGVTLNGTELRFYIDGALVGSADNFFAAFEGADDALFTLGITSFGDVPYQGLLDQLRIYDRALSAEEIATLAAENN